MTYWNSSGAGTSGLASSLGNDAGGASLDFYGRPTGGGGSSGGGLDFYGRPIAATAPADTGGGGSGFWGSVTNPLGLTGFVKNLGTGLATSLGGIAAHGISGLVDTGYNTAAALTGQKTNWGEVGSQFGQAGQGVGDVGFGLVLGAEDLTTTGANVVGAQNVMRDDVWRPLNRFVAGKDEHGEGTWNSIISPEMGQRLYGEGKGYGPEGFVKEAQTQGVGAALLTAGAEAAIVAPPVAATAAAFAGDAADAAALAAERGAAEQAASYTARSETLGQVAKAATAVHTVGRFGYNPIGAAGALVEGKAGAFADEALASSEDGTVPTSAKVARGASVIGQATNTPLKFIGIQAADLLAAMRERAYPTVLPTEGTTAPPEAPAAPEATQGVSEAPPSPEELALVRGAQHPQVAAAEAMGQTVPPDPTEGLNPVQQVPVGDLTPGNALRHEITPGSPTEPLVVQRFGEEQRVVEGNHRLAAAIANGDEYVPVTYEQAPDQLGGLEGMLAPKAEAKIEPEAYPGAEKGRPPAEVMSVREQQMRQEDLQKETAAARERQTPSVWVYDQLGRRLSAPTPIWAQNIAEALPDSINRTIGKLAPFIEETRMRNLQRALVQTLETSQQYARSSPAMRQAEDAARMVLDRTITRSQASDMIGQEIYARLYGEQALAEWLKNNNGFMPSAEQKVALVAAARGQWKGITQEVWDKLTPQDRAGLEQHLHDAVTEFKAQALDTREKLLASRYGAKGLEHAILDPNDVGMTGEQMRLYQRSIRDQRFAEKASERVPGEVTRREAKVAVAEATGERKWGVVDRLRNKLGLSEATTEELYRGIPDGMRNNAEVVIGNAVDAIAQGAEHVVIDPATGSIIPPEAGIFVPMALQGAGVPIQDWATQGEAAVRDSILNPVSKDGNTYDPVRLFTGMDARVVLARITDGDGTVRVQPMLGMHSINGDPILPWQARILGDAFEQHAGYNFSDGSQVPFSSIPTDQVVAAHYVGDVLDTRSQLTRWANEKVAVAAQVGIGPEQVQAEISAFLTLDRLMAQRDGAWKTGDAFKTETAVGKNEPSLPHLLQTIMPELSTSDHFVRALTHADFESVNKMLAWYYTSHQAIEDAWRFNEDGTEKMTPFGRSAAETFYDLIAASSVMASPTQNLGRALAANANLDDFLAARKGAYDDAEQMMNEVMGKVKNDVVYVKNVNTSREDYMAANPKGAKESEAAYNRRVDRNSEREVARGEGGTAVSRRWLGSIGDFEYPARKLTAQTSMTTSPKYRLIDILMGKLDLSRAATAEAIGAQPEWWMEGGGRNFSDTKLTPDAVLHHADLLGVTGQPVDDYQQWAVDHANLVGAKQVREDPNWVKPITDAEDVQRQRAQQDAAESGTPLLGGREVSPQEYQNLAAAGRAYVESAQASSTPHVLDTPETRQAAWDALHPTDTNTWPGGTFDAHTGEPIPSDYNGDTYAVTAKVGNMKTITTPLNATPKQFDAAYTKALKAFAPILNSEGGHLGIFENHDTGVIEFDPVYHTQTVGDTEAVGAYTHAHGGAYNFATEYGYWIPHVRDELTWSAKSGQNGPTQDVNASVQRGRTLAKAPEMRQAYENALMEYHGSALLAKLRSFRDNLASPHDSLAVTLDSIMAQLWGIEGTPWSTKNEYSGYADQVRDVAKTWSQVAGRQVMPHEVQAALWVYAKRFIGEQDWGRWNAHLTQALDYIDTIEKLRAEGKTVKLPNTVDLLSEAWKQQLQFSQDHLAIRTERTPLREKASAAARGKGPELTPEESDRLAYLEQQPGRRVSQVLVQPDGAPVEPQQRDETYFDANTLRGQEDQYVKYLTEHAAPIRDAIRADDFDRARKLVTDYVASRQKSMLAGIDGAAFDEVIRKGANDPKSVTFDALRRLAMAKHVPQPNVEGLTSGEVFSKFADRVRGATIEHPNALGRIMMRLYQSADFTTMLHEDMHAFRMMAPGDDVAKFSEAYPNIQHATLTPERIADEERFVEDFMAYMHDRARAGDPRLSPAMRAQVKYRGPMAELFNNVADAIDEYSRVALHTTGGHTIDPHMVSYWDNLFNQDIVKPDIFHDPLSQQYDAENVGVNPKQLRGESTFNFTQRVRQYGEGRATTTALKGGIIEATRRAKAADDFAAKMKATLSTPTRSEAIAAKLQERASKTLGKVAGQLADPNTQEVPKLWRPFMEAIDRIREEAKTDPSMAPLLDEIPENFAKALEFATQLGFEPAYMPDMTWQMANRYMYGHLTLGENAEESSMRKQNRSVLSRAGITDRSMEALGSGTVMAMKELLQSRLVQFVEENYARKWKAGVEIPEGWRPWSATRDAILTGKNIEGKVVAANDALIVPDAVHRTLRRMQASPVDMPFRTLWKGGPTTVWKNLILTYSPSWYLKHFIGSTTLAALEGVRLQDWRTAWKQFKTDTYPDVVKGKTIYGALDLDARTLIPRNKITDFPDLVRSEGIRAGLHEVTSKLQNVVKTVESMNRAAVYARTIRLSENPALAASRAIEALGDFGRLNPLERNVVSSVMPFYSFQKAMFRILLRLPIDHPYVTIMAMQLGLMHQEYLRNKLGGEVPDAYATAIMLNGHLTPVAKMNPLTDSYKLVTPEGIGASLHPFIKPLAEDAFGGQSYGADAGMSPTGVLQPKADFGQEIGSIYTDIPALGGSPANVYSGLSDAQYEKLVKRIAKFSKAKQLVDAGGYLTTDANAPRKGTG